MCDLIVKNARELLTLAGAAAGPRCGDVMADLGIIHDGALAVEGDRIFFVGRSSDILDFAQPYTQIIDASDCVVMPGFVDAHTHLVFAGDRAAEFERRLRGATYLDILAAGGGILSTVRATRQASEAELVAQAGKRLATMLEYGTTTAEAKTGYGLELAGELKMLDVLAHLSQAQPVSIVPTFLPAHAVPPEFTGRGDDYVGTIVQDMLPEAAAWRERARNRQAGLKAGASEQEPGSVSIPFAATLFCDVFCDQGAFTLAQARAVLQAAQKLGFELKIHADEFAPLGGAGLAADLGAVSAEHLAVTPPDDIARMAAAGVIAVLLPGTTFGLASSHYADARSMITAGMAVALGTDLNPGTCYCESMPLMIALACRYLKMTPAEAICAATINAAYASGVGQSVGSLDAGKRADIIVLNTPDHRHLAYHFGTNPVARVIKSGQEVGSSR